MKKLNLILVALVLFCVVGCRLSPDDLAKKIEPDLVKNVQKNFCEVFILNKFIVVRVKGNNYQGLLEGRIDEVKTTFKFKIIYDGKNVHYEGNLVLDDAFIREISDFDGGNTYLYHYLPYLQNFTIYSHNE